MDKNQIEKQFSRHSRSYAEESRVQAAMAQALLLHARGSRLTSAGGQPARVFEFGAGSGNLTRLLARQWPEASLQLLDISESMLNLNRELLEEEGLLPAACEYIVGDVETSYPEVGSAPGTLDLVCSNATWQWLERPERLLQRIFASLKPGGVFLLGSFGPQTLQELYSCYARSQPAPLTQRVRYQSAQELSAQIAAAGFDVQSGEALFEEAHASPRELLRSLKRMGVTSCSGRAFTPSGYRRFDSDYREHYSFEHGSVRATWHAVFARGIKPAVH